MKIYDDHHRRITPIDDDEMERQDVPRESPPATIAGAATKPVNPNSNLRGVTVPTPVDPFSNARIKPHMDTVNVIMPFRTSGVWNTASIALTDPLTQAQKNAINTQYYFTLRLNSINDIVTAMTYNINPDTTLDTIAPGSTVERPMMWNYYQSLYKYYHVVGCKYKVKFYSLTGDNQEYSVWTYHHGIQGPPLSTTSTRLGADKIPVSDYMRRIHDNCHVNQFCDRTTGNSLGDFEKAVCEINGYFAPGPDHVKNQVTEDEEQRVWLKSNEVSPLREQATFILNRSDACRDYYYNKMRTTCPEMKIFYEIFVEYLVQWKDLDVYHQYPTNDESVYNTSSIIQP